MLVPIDLPPGVWKNGTRYQAKNRFYETNLVRWHDGALRPIGGWQLRTYQGADFPSIPEVGEQYRDMFAWRSNNKESLLVGGGGMSVKWIQDGGTYIDITPVGLTPGVTNPTVFNGYGTGLYGYEAYGVSRSADGLTPTPVARWKFDAWGENLIAMPDWPTDREEATLYEWIPSDVNVLVKIDEAPDGIIDFVITDQRIGMTIGDDVEARKVRWSDQENLRNWTPAVTNQAGDLVLSGSGSLIGLYKVGKQVLVLSETDAFVGTYRGPPYVYGFDRVGEDCAPVHRNAVVTTHRFAVWIGERNFWLYDGQLRELPSDLTDFIAEDAQTALYSKIVGWVNGDYTEVWWHYCSQDVDPAVGEPDSYITWDWEENHWAHGKLNRTAMVSNGTLPNATGIDHGGLPYWHELTLVEPPGNYAKTGPLELQAGEKNMAVRYIYPDVETPDDEDNPDGGVGQVNFQFEMRQMPTGRLLTSPVYTLSNPTPVRVLGRDIMMTVTGEKSGWEYGKIRLDVAPIGTGRR